MQICFNYMILLDEVDVRRVIKSGSTHVLRQFLSFQDVPRQGIAKSDHLQTKPERAASKPVSVMAVFIARNAPGLINRQAWYRTPK